MTKSFQIQGMTCTGCAAKIQSALNDLPNVVNAVVDKQSDTANIEFQGDFSLSELKNTVKSLDAKYDISQKNNIEPFTEPESKSWFATYRPILLVFFYLLIVTFAAQFGAEKFDHMLWMRNFMAGFFLTFSFFKMMDLEGFANSYMGYDIIAKKWRAWGIVYAFIELFLGLSYLINFMPLVTNIVAFTVMSVSIVGVLQSVLNKRKIQCACLGAVFDLPMSTVTIIEDALMIVMSGYMILNLM